MRNLILAALAATLFFASCKKEEVQPQPSGPAAMQIRSVHVRVETNGRWNGIVNSIHEPFDTTNGNLSWLHWNYYPAMSSVATGVHVQDYYLDSCRVGHGLYLYMVDGVNTLNNQFATYQQYADSLTADTTYHTNWYETSTINADSAVAGDWFRVTMIVGNDTTVISDTLTGFDLQNSQFMHTNQSPNIFILTRQTMSGQLFPEFQFNLPIVH